jgi:hypothetical protein
MNIQKIPPSRDGALVWLTAGKTRVSVLRQVFDDLGFRHLLPRREKRAIALRAAVVDFLPLIYGKRKLKPFPLDRRVLGFEVREKQDGAEKNDWPYLLTVKADERHAWITHDGLPGDPADSQRVSDLYLERMNYYCPTSTGSLVKRVIEEEWHGTSVRGNGGLWFLPGAFVPQYRKLAEALEQSNANPDSECVFSIAQFALSDNPEVARDAVAACVEDAKALAAEINADLLGTGDDATGMTGPGRAAREAKVKAMRARVEGYAQLFGVGMTETEQLLAAVESKLALDALADISA